MTLLYVLIITTLSIILIVIASRSEMLRNEVFNPDIFSNIASNMGIKKPKPAFSLGRTQLAFWTVIVVSTFIYVLIEKSIASKDHQVVVPDLDQVNLVLLSIAAGTTVLAKVIDNSQKNTTEDGAAQQDIPSKDFLTDIISDEKGVSIHRLQNVIWTVVVGSIYIGYVISSKEIPNDKVITTQLLGLMGISTGTYLGLKTAENKAAPAAAASPGAGVATPTAPGSSTQPSPAGAATAANDISNSAQHDF